MKALKALALKYDETLPAPFILAKGEGELAEAIVTIARARGVPVIEKPQEALQLFSLEAGSFIPEECFGIVAEMLVFVHNVSKSLYSIGDHE